MYQDRLRLDGKIAVVTGGTRGIGLAIGRALAEFGALPILAGRNEKHGAAAVDVLKNAGFTAEFKSLDVGNSTAVSALMADVAEAHGRLDIVIANAGIAIEGDALVQSDSDWQNVLDINASGVFWTVREAARHMKAGGAIVVVGSMSGLVANVPQKHTAYNASKAAANMIARSMAVELADKGIRVNAIAPGYVRTDMTEGGIDNLDWFKVWSERTPLGRVAEPEEIASLAHFLASPASSYMTGSIVVADGGYTST
ncbi:UNVERIFIED_ORG: NAD(P)-dependent dehydrogenase (short-subunit alcohol dehydrogenase family) [Shinella zoogloeoides]|nr:NAD(P)-dependent dehydrogenase (short-subunit alcohol dehydrogenase family) [Shinella zoogloeoides]